MLGIDCVIKCPINGILLLLPALYFFCICVCLHMLCIKVIRKQVWGRTQRQQNEIWSRKSWILESNEARTTYAKVGPKWVREWAAKPPLWAGWPSTVPPHVTVHPWLGLHPVWSIFNYLTFCFEPNWKSFDKTTLKHKERLFQSWLEG